MFILHCIEPKSGIDIDFKFDNITHSLYTLDDQIFENYKWQIKRSLIKGKKVRLMMGTNCNLNCSYCSQEKTDIEYSISDCSNILNVLSKIKEPISIIEFWGGEPLAYIKYIKILVDLIRSDRKYDKTEFAIITNGYLLNDNIVDFLIQHQFRIQISYDGYTQIQRSNFDYFELKIPYIKRLLNNQVLKRKRCVNFATVLTSKQDLIKAQSYFQKHFKQKVNLQPIPLLFMNNKLMSHRLDNIKQRNIFKQTYDLSIKDENFYSCQLQTNELACSILHHNPQESSRPCVTADDKDVVIDLKGNIFLCQNRCKTKDVIGNLFNNDYFDIKHNKFNNYSFCNECLLSWSCHGSCRILKDQLFTETCRSYFYYYFAMFCAAIYKITGCVVKSVDNLNLPVYQNNHIEIKHFNNFKAVEL